MSKDFEKEYREYSKLNTPDLWSRIEAGLDEVDARLADSAPVSNATASDVSMRDMSNSTSYVNHTDEPASVSQHESESKTVATSQREPESNVVDITRKKKFHFTPYMGAIVAAACVLISLPALIFAPKNLGSGTAYSEVAVARSATDAIAEEPAMTEEVAEESAATEEVAEAEVSATTAEEADAEIPAETAAKEPAMAGKSGAGANKAAKEPVMEAAAEESAVMEAVAEEPAMAMDVEEAAMASDSDNTAKDKMAAGKGVLGVSAYLAEDYPGNVDKVEFVTIGDSKYLTKVVLKFKGDVKNLSLMTYNITDVADDGTVSADTEEVYSRKSLKSGSTLGFELEFPGDLSAYALSYTDESGEQKSFSISLSGRDGSVVLAEMEK